MKLKYDFESVDMGDEIVLVPVGKNASEVCGIIKLDAAGKEIFDLLVLYGEEDEVVRVLAGKYENNREALRAYVGKVTAMLRDNRLIED